MLTDTHCHLQVTAQKLGITLDELIKQSQEAGISRLVNINVESKEWDDISKLNWPGEVYNVAGIQPHDVEKFDQEQLNTIEKLAQEGKIIGIGEIGLDFHWNGKNREAQEEVFATQIDLAIKYSLPIVLHLRDAEGENIVFDITHKLLTNRGVPTALWHCFSGPLDEAKQFFELNPKNKISIGGILTFKNADSLRQIIKQIPIEKIMLETDSPFLAPEPYRGQICTPAFINTTSEFLSKLLGIEKDDLEKKLEKNVKEFWGV